MRQFDVYENPSNQSRRSIPYLVVLQSHFFEDSPTVVVAPLIFDNGSAAYTLASVRLTFNDQAFALALAELANIERLALRRATGNVREHEDAIRRALDRLFTGF